MERTSPRMLQHCIPNIWAQQANPFDGSSWLCNSICDHTIGTSLATDLSHPVHDVFTPATRTSKGSPGWRQIFDGDVALRCEVPPFMRSKDEIFDFAVGMLQSSRVSQCVRQWQLLFSTEVHLVHESRNYISWTTCHRPMLDSQGRGK